MNAIALLKQEVQANIRHSPNGIHSKFVQVNEHWGLKLYNCDAMRDRCFKRQGQAAKLDVGPAVGGLIDLGEETGYYRYGYMSEKVTTVESILEDDNDCFDSAEIDEIFDDWYDENSEEMDEVHRVLNGMGFFFSDCHVGNWGVNSVGKLVCIDFG